MTDILDPEEILRDLSSSYNDLSRLQKRLLSKIGSGDNREDIRTLNDIVDAKLKISKKFFGK